MTTADRTAQPTRINFFEEQEAIMRERDAKRAAQLKASEKYWPYPKWKIILAEPQLPVHKLKIYDDCIHEMLDIAYDPSMHASASTYRQGCRGPMCTYARSSAQQGGSNFLANDLIEYLSVFMWTAHVTRIGRISSIYEAHKTIRIFYGRLKEQELTAEIDEMFDIGPVGSPSRPLGGRQPVPVKNDISRLAEDDEDLPESSEGDPSASD